MTVYSEEILGIPVGLGIDSYNHPANLQEGYCPSVKNFLAKQDRLVTRLGFQPTNSVDTRSQYVYWGVENRYTKLPNSHIDTFPVAMWSGIGAGSVSTTWMIRQFFRDSPAESNPNSLGIQAFPAIRGFFGACTYLDRVYIGASGSNGIIRCTNFNWVAGTCTMVSVPNTSNFFNGPFVFKDRLWAWDSTKIYYTLPPSSPGAYPESWDQNGQYIVIGAGTGLGKIYSVIPVGTKLFVFTASGLYNISVLGSPENWVVRLMDATVKVNSYSCAVEDKGLVFFVDSRGVWVTNQDEVKLISEKINDVFQEQVPNTYFVWKLFPFAEGIVLLRQKIQPVGTYPSASNRVITEARIFYTRLDFIAWTEITFDTTTQPGDIIAGFSNLESHAVWSPSNYLVLAHGNSLPGTYVDLTSELLRYQGFEDKLRKTGSSQEVAPVRASYSSKLIRGIFTTEKRGKYGFINFSSTGAPGADTNLDYVWDTEAEINRMSDSISTYDIMTAKEGLIKIMGPEFFRHAQFYLTATLSSAIQEYTVLGSALVMHSHRRTPRVDS